MYVMTDLRHHYLNSYRMAKNEDISNPFEVTERGKLAVQNIVDKNMYLTLLFLSQHYTHLDTCPKCHQHEVSPSLTVLRPPSQLHAPVVELIHRTGH